MPSFRLIILPFSWRDDAKRGIIFNKLFHTFVMRPIKMINFIPVLIKDSTIKRPIRFLTKRTTMQNYGFLKFIFRNTTFTCYIIYWSWFKGIIPNGTQLLATSRLYSHILSVKAQIRERLLCIIGIHLVNVIFSISDANKATIKYLERHANEQAINYR